MKRAFFLLALLSVLAGCASMQKTLHYATLGLVNSPDVSEAAKVDLLKSQQETDLRYKQLERDHTLAIIAFVVGLTIVVGSKIAAAYVPFLKPENAKVGYFVMACAAVIRGYVSMEASAGKYLWPALVGLIVLSVAFILYKALIHKKLEPAHG